MSCKNGHHECFSEEMPSGTLDAAILMLGGSGFGSKNTCARTYLKDTERCAIYTVPDLTTCFNISCCVWSETETGSSLTAESLCITLVDAKTAAQTQLHAAQKLRTALHGL